MRAILKAGSVVSVVLLLMLVCSCKKTTSADNQKKILAPDPLNNAVTKLTQVITHDIFSPTVASRIYMYSSVAAYEALVPLNSDYQSLTGQLKGFTAGPKPEAAQTYCFPLASVHAFMKVARTLTFSVEMYDEFENKLYEDYKDMGIPDDVFDRSIAFGDSVAAHVIRYSSKDNYKQTRGFRHTITNQPGTWVPTPPGYMDGIEPQWFKIRTLTLDSASQFKPVPPPAYNTDKNSAFFKEAQDVYDVTTHMTEEQKWIANFWDCNPFKLNVAGHVNFATKKMSPGGHWMSISNIISRQYKADIMKTAETYALVSIALFDGFISCWDEKYRSVRVRPETAINQLIDKDWTPFLQTPPFPEYTSGHSVISTASATVLTHLYGDNISFVDSTEVQYGIPPRSFKSFRQACEEAAISRLYGGIHYRSAIEVGLVQGGQVGEWVLGHIQTHKVIATKSEPTKQAN
ncbi:vanadium-dependent haloperoxidase [Xanthocytophaga agilis]|uniref:Vanadium-dependent haloperoxidase n=1 Tax=Xanthocytophaga agilis TaxID=3048010 RepID=A0AAE3R4L7_9BACT|nr:vanadium-dependent haloperoxidase [Xanthocytophaga agilis]MDJ1500587.1 vanadium-dependent haloperoxidase [Xanthocytophaga agilis]